MVLEAMRAYPDKSVTEISHLLGLSKSLVYRMLKDTVIRVRRKMCARR